MSEPRREGRRLWGHRNFLRLWAGQSISELGSQVSQLAIPLLAAVDLHASPIEFSLLEVAGFAPFLLFALPAGAWVDRLRRRPVLIVGDASRAVLLSLIPVLWYLHQLRVWELLVLQFVTGTATVLFDVAYQSYLPSLVDRDDLVEGNARLQLTASTAQVAGPGASGALVGLVGAPYAIVADAASFVVSTAFTLRIRHAERPPERADRRPILSEALEGVRFVVGHPWLRRIAACTATSNLFSNMSFAILVLYMVRKLHMSSLTIGLVFAAGSAGAVVGALAAGRLQRRIGTGPTIVAGALFGSLAGLALPLAPRSLPIPVLIAGLFASSLGAVTYNIAQVSLRQAITPERLQGRMNAGMRWIVWGTIPLGSLAGGIIGQVAGLHVALWAGAVGGLTGFLPVTLGPVRAIREVPEPPGDTETVPALAAEGPLAAGVEHPGAPGDIA